MAVALSIFGSVPVAAAAGSALPIGVVDAVGTTQSSISLTGWALDPDTVAPIGVHVYIDGAFAGQAVARMSRPDVAAVFGLGDAHGYNVTVPAGAGTHRVCVYGIDSTGGYNPALGCQTVSVVNAAPIGWLDSLTTTQSSISMSGWALDPDTSASIDVHVYVDGAYAGATTARSTRPDVGSALGHGAEHGYSLTIPASLGSHRVCLYGIDSSGGYNPPIACRTAAVVNAAPRGWVDSLTTTQNSITVAGWALDPDTSASIAVHVYVDGTYAGATTAQSARSDVGSAFALGSAHGFGLTVPASPGTHQVCIYGIDSTGGFNPTIACRGASVVNAAPTGWLDSVITTQNSVTLSGWALDPDTTASITVDLFVDGALAASTAANRSRTDVGAAFGLGDAHGFDVTGAVSPGSHQVCVTGSDATAATRTQLACRAVTIAGPTLTAAAPSALGVPGDATTGVPAGVVLTASGPLRVTTPNAVIDGLDISGSVSIEAPGVVIRNSRIHGTDSTGVYVRSGSVTIYDSEIYGFENGIGFDNWSAYRVDIHGTTGDGVKLGSNVTLADSWIHGLTPAAGAHADGGQVQSGVSNLVVRHNVIDLSGVPSANAALFIAPDLGPSTPGPLTITDNWLDGGNYVLFCVDGNNGQYLIGNISITNNRFGRHSNYGPSRVNVPITQSGNVWADTGAALGL